MQRLLSVSSLARFVGLSSVDGFVSRSADGAVCGNDCVL